MVPYIGDLVGNNAAPRRRDAAPGSTSPRTIYYRRRKGTLPMLEELARDVTGWGAHAVEFFELLGWTQHLNHLRFQARWPDTADIDRLDRMDGPFDEVAHTVDVRPPGTVEGWHTIANIGFFLYRLRSYPAQGVVLTDAGGDEHARAAPAPCGCCCPTSSTSAASALRPRCSTGGGEGDEAGLATEPFVPGPIRPIAFMRDLDRLVADPVAALDYYGAASLAGARSRRVRRSSHGGSLRGQRRRLCRRVRGSG